jgi:hypothetical protein
MKTFFKPLFLMVATVLLFTQCKKDDTPSPGNTSGNYSPLTTGSNWTYNYTEGTTSETVKLTVTDKDTTINGKTYKVLSSSDNSGNSYLAKIDSNYYRFSTFPEIGSFEELYLKDNRPVNSTWKQSVPFKIPGSPAPLTADLTYTIQDVGITRTVNGKQYDKVIHVNVGVNVLSVNFGGGDFYYANNVGMIESTISLTPPTGSPYTSTEQLVSYEIK